MATVSPERLLPAALAQLGLGWWERGLAGESHAFQEFIHICDLLEARASKQANEIRWIHDIAIPKYGLTPPFSSALAQAQAASVFVRAHQHTGLAKYEQLARGAISPLLLGSETELVTQSPQGPVLEEIPTTPRSHILNGWITALWGLLDVSLALHDERATVAFSEGCETLLARLDLYDVGWWTKYSLYPTALPDLAKPYYHQVHIDQVDVLFRLTGDSGFQNVADRWRGYDSVLHRVRVIGQKALFVARLSSGRLQVADDADSVKEGR